MTFVAKFLKDARVMAGDLRHRKIIHTALGKYEIARDKRKAAFQGLGIARARLAAETKWEAVNHLDKYLEEFVAKLEARGTKVHWAEHGGAGARNHFAALSATKRRVPSSSPRR